MVKSNHCLPISASAELEGRKDMESYQGKQSLHINEAWLEEALKIVEVLPSVRNQ